MSIPKVLQITREYTKPGKAGLIHEQKESVFVQAMARAKWPTYYLGMTSLSGKQRALFLTQYASFEAWEKDTAAVAKTAPFPQFWTEPVWLTGNYSIRWTRACLYSARK